jgi:hypothetical protein
MALVLDAGALIAVERQSPGVLGRLRVAAKQSVSVRTSSAVVAQVWRDGARQARVSWMLRGMHEVPLDPTRSRSIGALLGRNGSLDVVDAAIVELLHDGDEILTSDPIDIAKLASTAGYRVRVVPV